MRPLRLLLYTASSPALDVALEEAIQLGIEAGTSPETWRLWQPAQPAVIIGTGQESAREVELAAAKKAKVPVLRRHSGGGTVLIGPGALNYSCFATYGNLAGSETIRGAMVSALQPVVQTLAAWGINAREVGLSDLAVVTADGSLRKIAGNSQARKKHSVVVHGTLLADPDFALITRLLRFPSSVPDYRAGRDHKAFLTSLKDLSAPCSLVSLAEKFVLALPAGILMSNEPLAAELERAQQLLKEKYGTKDWNFRR